MYTRRVVWKYIGKTREEKINKNKKKKTEKKKHHVAKCIISETKSEKTILLSQRHRREYIYMYIKCCTAAYTIYTHGINVRSATHLFLVRPSYGRRRFRGELHQAGEVYRTTLIDEQLWTSKYLGGRF